MITCEHCGSPLPDGAIFCGECGRAVTPGSARRSAAPETERRDTPPPLRQPDPYGRPRQDPASEAWLPEATLDPATRAWLAGRDRGDTGPVAPIPVATPDDFGPRTAPTHVHGAGSGVGEWARPAASPQAPPAEPPLDPDAFPNEPGPSVLPEDVDVADVQPHDAADGGRRPAPAAWSRPVQPPPPPAAPSWWVGRSGASAESTESTPDEPAAAEPVDVASGAAGPAPAAPAPAAPGVASSSDASTPVDDAPGDAVADEPSERPTANDTAVVPPFEDRPAPMRPAPLVQPGSQPTSCHMCGHRLEPDDIFCEECGAVRPAVTAAFTGPVVPLPVERPDWAADDVLSDGDADDDDDSDDGDSDDGGRSDGGDPDGGGSDGSVPDERVRDDEQAADAADDASAPVLPPAPGSATMPTSAPRAEPLPPGPFVPKLPPVPGAASSAGTPAAPPEPALPAVDPVPSSADADESAALDEDVEETRIVSKEPAHAPFVLHFSTGERVGFHGTGLLGRLPRPEAGERFDDLLTIRDPGKSVSKTHLELGRDGDDLWVSDRFSGNGTVVRHIDGSIRRCEPGRRYRVERGARVDIGEQFFLVQ